MWIMKPWVSHLDETPDEREYERIGIVAHARGIVFEMRLMVRSPIEEIDRHVLNKVLTFFKSFILKDHASA